MDEMVAVQTVGTQYDVNEILYLSDAERLGSPPPRSPSPPPHEQQAQMEDASEEHMDEVGRAAILVNGICREWVRLVSVDFRSVASCHSRHHIGYLNTSKIYCLNFVRWNGTTTVYLRFKFNVAKFVELGGKDIRSFHAIRLA